MSKTLCPRLIALGTTMVALTAIPAIRAQAATDALNIDAEVVASPLAVNATQDLNFGAFTNGGAGGTVTVNTAGVGNYVGVTQVMGGPPTSAGQVTLGGNTGQPIVFSVTSPTVVVAHTATPTITMAVNAFNVRTNAGGQTETFALTQPTESIPIGATLTVPAGRPPGAYTGTFTVQAVYD